ncbi:MAG TPA: hypothetical protein VGM32_05310 [Rhodopila sp.]
MNIKTASWFTETPAGHVKIGISRGVPRRMAPGYRMFRRLAPGPWFNSVSVANYDQLYRTEILARLNPQLVAGELLALARGNVAVLVCFERPNTGKWCHRSLAALWLAEALGEPVREIGFETRPAAGSSPDALGPLAARRHGTAPETFGQVGAAEAATHSLETSSFCDDLAKAEWFWPSPRRYLRPVAP